MHHSAEADLPLLGSGERDSVDGLLLGSTSKQCARYADCPDMITRAARERQFEGQAVVHREIAP